MSKELTDIPPRYGTNNCIDCGKEPPENKPFWEVFREWTDGKVYSFPVCDKCHAEVEISLQHASSQKQLKKKK